MKTLTAWTLVFFVCGAGPGLAQQTGKSAIDAWIGGSGPQGLSLDYGSAEERGDTVVIRDFSLSYRTQFQLDAGSQRTAGIAVEFDATAPQVVVTGAAHDGSGLSADRLDYADKLTYALKVRVDGDAVFDYAGSMQNFRLDGFFWPRFPAAPLSLKGSAKAWIDWFHTLAKLRIDEAAADLVTLHLSIAEETDIERPFTTSAEYRDFRFKGLRDGRVESSSTGLILQETHSVDEGEPHKETATIEATGATGVNFLAPLVLFDPKPAGTGDYVEMVESAHVDGYRTVSDLFEFSIARLAYENLAVRPPETDLAALMDLLLSGAEPDAPTILTTVLDVYRSFSLGLMSLEGFEWSVAGEDGQAIGGIRRTFVSDLSSDGLGEVAWEGVRLSADNLTNFALDRIAISDLEFPPHGPIRAFASDESAWEDPDPVLVARIFSPLSVVMELKNLGFALPDKPGEFTWERFYLELRSSVPPVPTLVEVVTKGFNAPVAMGGDEDVVKMLMDAGIESIRFDEDIRIRWDEQTEDLIVENLQLEWDQMVRFQVSVRLGGLPRSLLENPARLEALMFTMNVKSVELDLQNDGLFEFTMVQHAKDSGISLDRAYEKLMKDLKEGLDQVGNDSFSAMVLPAVEAFVADPRNLHVRIAPSAPVPLAQIMSDAMVAPDALPERLGVTVEANR